MSFHCVCHVASIAWVVPSNGKENIVVMQKKMERSVSTVKKVHQGSPYDTTPPPIMSKWYAPLSSDNPKLPVSLYLQNVSNKLEISV